MPLNVDIGRCILDHFAELSKQSEKVEKTLDSPQIAISSVIVKETSLMEMLQCLIPKLSLSFDQ